jgi:hypothetical protein
MQIGPATSSALSGILAAQHRLDAVGVLDDSTSALFDALA